MINRTRTVFTWMKNNFADLYPLEQNILITAKCPFASGWAEQIVSVPAQQRSFLWSTQPSPIVVRAALCALGRGSSERLGRNDRPQCDKPFIHDNESGKSCVHMCISNTETVLKGKNHLEEKHRVQIIKDYCSRCFKKRSWKTNNICEYVRVYIHMCIHIHTCLYYIFKETRLQSNTNMDSLIWIY